MAEELRNNPSVSQSRSSSGQARQSKPHVLPDQIPPEVTRILHQTLQLSALTGALLWIVDRIPETDDPLELAEHLSERYEQQVLRLKEGLMKDYILVFRVAFAWRCLEVLPYFSMRIVKAGYNPLFLKSWFQKRLLASMVGISVHDVERRARSSGLRVSEYLNDQIGRIFSQTSLAQLMKDKK